MKTVLINGAEVDVKDKVPQEFLDFARDNWKNTEDKKQGRRLSDHSKMGSGMMLYNSKGHSVSWENHWKGESAFLVLSGPSAKQVDLGLLEGNRGIVTMAVNNAWSLLRPTLWTAVDDPNTFMDVGWKDPGIMKLVPYGKMEHRLGLKKADGSFIWSGKRVNQVPNVWFYHRNDRFDPDTYLWEDTVNWGCHQSVRDKLGCKGSRSVMLAAVRLLYYLGFRNIYLVGADFKMVEGPGAYAFGQSKDRGGVKGNMNTYRDLNVRFKHMRPMMEEAGLKIYNTYADSGLVAFDHMPFDKAVAKVAERFQHFDPVGWYDAWVGENGKKVPQGVNPPPPKKDKPQ